MWVADSLLLIRVKAIACSAVRDRKVTPKRSEVSQSARTVQGNATGLARDEVTTEERNVLEFKGSILYSYYINRRQSR